MAEKWIQGAIKKPGSFTAQAKVAGKSVGAYAKSVLKEGSKASTISKRRAVLAQTLKKLARKRAKKSNYSQETITRARAMKGA